MDGKAWKLAVAIGLLVVAAGCLGEDGDDLDADTARDRASENATNDPPVDRFPARILEASFPGAPGFAADARCVFGGGPQLDRTGEPVPEGTQRLVINVTVEPGTTGLQAGYTFAENAPDHASRDTSITWTPSRYEGSETYEVDVGDRVEGQNKTERWAFYYRVNPGVDELCFTGVTVSEWSITVEAVRGP